MFNGAREKLPNQFPLDALIKNSSLSCLVLFPISPANLAFKSVELNQVVGFN